VDSEIWTFNNWLKDGSFDDWSSSSALTNWTASGATLTRTADTTFGGAYSCALSTGTGYVGQSVTNNADLIQLANTRPTFYARVKATTASQVRLAIYDGTTTTYSDYHTGAGGWELLSVTPTANIDTDPTDVAFRVYYASAATTAYVNDASVICGVDKWDYDISDLEIDGHVPSAIYTIDDQDAGEDYPRPRGYSTFYPYWKPLGDGRIQFTRSPGEGTKLRIVGMKHLTQPDSSTSTEPNAPQTGIISALAAAKLYGVLANTAPTQSVQTYVQLQGYWVQEAQNRRRRYGLRSLPITRSL
jgi:hypothetical protein